MPITVKSLFWVHQQLSAHLSVWPYFSLQEGAVILPVASLSGLSCRQRSGLLATSLYLIVMWISISKNWEAWLLVFYWLLLKLIYGLIYLWCLPLGQKKPIFPRTFILPRLVSILIICELEAQHPEFSTGNVVQGLHRKPLPATAQKPEENATNTLGVWPVCVCVECDL